ncbi:hypothetical protein G1K57_01520 [Tenacibaculum finnmarkense]|uniref:hypothetical protein n=1 Tax=Tenacibaculum finnmarkense TaxID=2781243 RepID=UPI001E3E88A6|nr:hypothetical protein [Tenacibaculum finnmarkense]MCD8401073.1 hypothetical protein [Tenacibaculum finnmarkense genomovar ulcerans]MCG8806828.1 hypothetical protein [Tenacibaculum finnmarkense]MCG8817068.1 hypothetical protein [Tenacibaculum finnmarkense]
MKNTFKTLFLLVTSFFIISCNNEDPTPDSFEENINQERFKGLEIGNSDFILPQSNVDIHIEFDYLGTSKVTKIYFDVEDYNTSKANKGEVIWGLKNHVVPVKNYENQLNPHIHYHLYFDEENKQNPSFKAATGVYNFKITVEHEDGTKSVITKKLSILQKFKHLEIGENNTVNFGEDELHTEFEYISEPNTVTQIKYELWFKEWRANQKVAIGKWNSVVTILPKNLYEGIKNPHIHYHYDLLAESPKQEYWLNIYVQEKGEKEMVKLSVLFNIE